MVRQIANIVLSCVLSLMIVLMGVGVASFHCEHRGAITRAQAAMAMQHHSMPGCGDQGPCVSMKVMKLPPSLTSSRLTLSKPQLTLTLAIEAMPATSLTSLLPDQQPAHTIDPTAGHAPPRAYLQRLTLLLI